MITFYIVSGGYIHLDGTIAAAKIGLIWALATAKIGLQRCVAAVGNLSLVRRRSRSALFIGAHTKGSRKLLVVKTTLFQANR